MAFIENKRLAVRMLVLWHERYSRAHRCAHPSQYADDA